MDSSIHTINIFTHFVEIRHGRILSLQLLRYADLRAWWKKGKFRPRTGHEDPEREYSYSSTLCVTSTLDGGGWLTPRLGRFTPRKDTRYALYRRLGGPLDRSGRGVENLAPPQPFCILLYSLYFIPTCFFVLVVLNFAFIYTTQRKHPCTRQDSNPQLQQALGHWDQRFDPPTGTSRYTDYAIPAQHFQAYRSTIKPGLACIRKCGSPRLPLHRLTYWV